MGKLSITTPGPYSDYSSFKKYMEGLYGTNKIKEVVICINQTGTGSAVRLEEAAAATITQIGTTAVTLVLAGDADDAATNDLVYTLTYLTSAGVEKTTTATGTSTLSSSPVAFSPAADDVYCMKSFTASAAQSVVEVYAKVAGGASYATIAVDSTEAAAASLHGVGDVYGRHVNNHSDGAGFVATMDYVTPWGEVVEGATCTLTTDKRDEVRFIKTTGEYVGDFYAVRQLYANKPTTTNTGAFLLTDADCAATDGSGGDVYGGIKVGEWHWVSTRYYVPADRVTYLGYIQVEAHTAVGTLGITITDNDSNLSTSFSIPWFIGGFELHPLCALAEQSYLTMTITGNSAIVTVEIKLLEIDLS